MWKKLKPFLIILSVGLNLAFVGTWIAHAACVGRTGEVRSCDEPKPQSGVWCPLHRQLGIDEEQWQEIEPRLLEFQKSARELCGDIGKHRLELLDLIATADPDQDAIRARQDAILAGQRKMQELVIERLLAEKDMLTPEQCEMFFQLLRDRSSCAGHGPMVGSGPHKSGGQRPCGSRCGHGEKK